MHRYEELEKLYYRNKIKRFVFFILILIAVTLLFVFFYKIFFKKSTETKKNNVDLKKTTALTDKKSVQKKQKNIHKKTDKKSSEKTGKTLKKSLNKNNHENKNTVPNFAFEMPKIKPDEFKHVQNKKNKTTEQKKVNKTNKKNIQKTVHKKIQVIPQIKEETINIKDLINAFNKEPTYDTAMVISNYYYNKNDLSDAKLWALKANNIDPSKYQSWKMFALILLKKNDKIKAKEVLKIYLNDYGNNVEISKLLRSIDE